MKFSEMVDLIINMNSGNKPAQLTEAIENNNNRRALRLINKTTYSAVLYRFMFSLRNRGKSLLEAGWGGVRSPLEGAARRGNMEVLNALLAAGVNVDSKDYLDWTPLQVALLYKQDAAAIALINAGADVNARFRSIDAVAKPEDKYFFPLQTAVVQNVGLPVIQLLVEKGAEVNLPPSYTNILVNAVRYIPDEDAEKIEFLLRQGAEPNVCCNSHDKEHNFKDASPLFHALDQGKTRIAILLLRYGAKIYFEDRFRQFMFWEAHPMHFVLPQEMIDAALILCRENDIPIPEMPVRQPRRNAVPMFIAYREAGIKRNTINTHTESVHKSVSESALRLQQASKVDSFNAVNLATIADCAAEQKNLPALQQLITTALQDKNARPTHHSIITAVKTLTKKIERSSFIDDGRESGSKIKLSKLLILVGEAINKLESSELRLNAMLKLIEHMYLAHQDDICESGIFNTVIYSQQSILPEVNVLMQTKTNATDTLMLNLHNYAKEVFDNNNEVPDAIKFQEIVKQQASLDVCATIMRKICAEYFMVFKIRNQSDAARLSHAELSVLCKEFVGQDLIDIFELLNYSELYLLFIQDKQTHLALQIA